MGTISLTDFFVVGFTGTFSIWHWLIVLAVVLILFGGGGKIPRLMKDLGSGIKQFKRGMKEEDKEEETEEEPKAIAKEEATTVNSSAASEKKEGEKKKAANG